MPRTHLANSDLGVCGFTVPEQIGATTRYFFDNWGSTARQVAELPAMPWISSSASPAPASR